VVNWTARPQLSSVDGYDLFRGILTSYGSDTTLATLVCLQSNIAQTAVGSPIAAAADAANPQLGATWYYLVGHSSKASGSFDSLGKRTNGTIRVAPVACP